MPEVKNKKKLALKDANAAKAAKAAASRTGEEIAQGYIDSCQMEIDYPHKHNPQSDFVPSALTL